MFPKQMAAEALEAHFSRVFTWFCGRGNSNRFWIDFETHSGAIWIDFDTNYTLFSSFHVVLWPRKLWKHIFLKFSRGSVVAEAIAEVAVRVQDFPTWKRRASRAKRGEWGMITVILDDQLCRMFNHARLRSLMHAHDCPCMLSFHHVYARSNMLLKL